MDRTITELMELMLELGEKTNHDIMFDYLGHVDGIDIRFFRGGWKPGEKLIDKSTESYRFYLDDDDAQIKINMLYNHFSEILKEGDNYEI